MILTKVRAVALFAAIATAATLTSASPNSPPTMTWDQICPDARVRLSEAPGWEGAYDAYSNPAATCTVIQNTSTAILWITVESPNKVVFLNGYRVNGDPRALPNEAGATAAGLRSSTPSQAPVLRQGFAVIVAPPKSNYWIRAVDMPTQVRAEMAIQLSRLTYAWLPPNFKQAAARAQIHQHVQACANAAVALQADLANQGRPTTLQELFNLLTQAPRTTTECKPVYDAAKPPKSPTNPLDTPQANSSRNVLQRLNSQLDDVMRLIQRGTVLLTR
ncbi:hypothetical protein [Streptomyces sp. enrichment culture]|uniref:hypothetical protein n=1 Tax=Streptomyces sp. enrichment culture TaxID=1795815 RepID=UPI003F55C9CE